MLPTAAGRVPPFGGGGYTLVELVTVMAIAGILAASIAPRFFSQQTFNERGYADELASALRVTQKTAVASGCQARLVLSAAGYAAWLQAASGNGCNTTDTTWSTPILGADGIAIQGSAPAGSAGSPAGIYQFDSEGRLASSPATSIVVGSRTLAIDAGSGLVQVQ